MRILVSWYPVRPYAHIRLYTRSHLSVSVAPRAASPRAGAPPGAGACRQPGLPGVYTISVTCRLPKVDLSVTEVVYTTKVVYLPVLIDPASRLCYTVRTAPTLASVLEGPQRYALMEFSLSSHTATHGTRSPARERDAARPTSPVGSLSTVTDLRLSWVTPPERPSLSTGRHVMSSRNES